MRDFAQQPYIAGHAGARSAFVSAAYGIVQHHLCLARPAPTPAEQAKCLALLVELLPLLAPAARHNPDLLVYADLLSPLVSLVDTLQRAKTACAPFQGIDAMVDPTAGASRPRASITISTSDGPLLLSPGPQSAGNSSFGASSAGQQQCVGAVPDAASLLPDAVTCLLHLSTMLMRVFPVQLHFTLPLRLLLEHELI